MIRIRLFAPLALASTLTWAQPAVTPFDSSQGSRPPDPWQLITSRGQRPTQFDVIEQDGRAVLMAYSADASASLSHPLRLDPEAFTRLRWSWRVDELPEDADLAERNRDDYAARLCVSFEPDPSVAGFGRRARRALGNFFGDDSPLAAICYTWDARYPRGHRATHSGNDRIGLIVLRDREDALANWVEESRDVLADYREHFGSDPLRVTAVLVAAATQATGGRSLAYFTDIELLPRD